MDTKLNENALSDIKAGDHLFWTDVHGEHTGTVVKDPKFNGGLKVGGRSVKNIYDESEKFRILKESETIRKVGGRTMMSAAMVLGKAREMANKADPNRKVKKSMKGIDDDHIAAARTAILKQKGIKEGSEMKHLSFKEYKEVHESVEAEIDNQIAEVTAKLDEAAFDWGKTKPDVSWAYTKDAKAAAGKSTTTYSQPGVLKHIGTYGSETHKAPNVADKPAEKKSVGRPKGSYGGAYKIDKGARDSKEYKDALSAKVRASKAQGFEDRAYFKKIMNDALLKHAMNLAKKEKSNS